MRARLTLSCLLVLITLGAPAPAHARKRELEGVVNVNTASADELQLLPGVGPAKVRDILAYRSKHPFRTPEEIVRIKGIGRKMFRRLRLHLAVSGPTTAQQVIRADPPPPDPLEPPAALRRPVPLLPTPRPGLPAARRAPPRPIPFPDADANHCLRKP
jgi:competence protein ComEA